LTDRHILSNGRARKNVTEMPNLGPVANLDSIVDYGSLMLEVAAVCHRDSTFAYEKYA
jgi:hypothetical protein